MLGAHGALEGKAAAETAVIAVGAFQRLRYRESAHLLPAYDGHHIQIYVTDFSGPHRRLLERGLVTEESSEHQYRFRDLVDLDSRRALFAIEHEVRSLTHPLQGRSLVNRNPEQTNRHYVRGHDAFRGTY